jgi:hypothetical protein
LKRFYHVPLSGSWEESWNDAFVRTWLEDHHFWIGHDMKTQFPKSKHAGFEFKGKYYLHLETVDGYKIIRCVDNLEPKPRVQFEEGEEDDENA